MATRSHAGDRITEAEQAVMEALWSSAELSANEVANAVVPQRGWSLATVKTLLSRLVAKQAVNARPDGKRFLYSPSIARADFAAGESRRLVDRLFGGSAAGLFAQLAESKAISEADLAQIETLVKGLRK
ncbi:MAG: BlaI/MecI/CopY family transcriptional regulator [Novosphingobium sp.]